MAMVHGRFQSSTVPRIIGSLRFESCLVNRLGMRANFLFDYFVSYWDDKDHCCCHCLCECAL